jgi:hypothetical protein
MDGVPPLHGLHTVCGLVRVRVVVALAAVVAMVGPLPAQAARTSPTAPSLAGTTVVAGVGSAAVEVQVPRRFSIDPGRPGLDLSFTGTWAAFAVVSGGDARQAARYRLSAIHLRAPAGCAAGGRVCPDRRGLTLPSFAPQAISDSGQSGGRQPRYDYPAGRYVVYLLTDPGRRVSLRWTIRGLPGQVALHAATHVRSWYSSALANGAGNTASMTGQTRQGLSRPGQVLDWTWAAYGRGPVKVDRQSMCLETGSDPPSLPVPRGDYCFWADELAELPAGAVFGRYCVPCSDGVDNPGSDLDGVDAGVSRNGVEAVVTSADYKVSYSMRILGSSPQVGRAFLAWEYLR